MSPIAQPSCTVAQLQLLRSLPGLVPIDHADRVWIFPSRRNKDRETGLVVVSVIPEASEDPSLRGLVTVGYVAELVKSGWQITPTVTEEGWAAADRIDRVIAGVLNRSGEGSGDPVEESLDGGPGEWDALTRRLESAGPVT